MSRNCEIFQKTNQSILQDLYSKGATPHELGGYFCFLQHGIEFRRPFPHMNDSNGKLPPDFNSALLNFVRATDQYEDFILEDDGSGMLVYSPMDYLREEVVNLPPGGKPTSNKPSAVGLDEFTQGYLSEALRIYERKTHHFVEWTDFDDETSRAFVQDCKKFQNLNEALLKQTLDAGMSRYQAGKTFYVLRNGLRGKDWLQLGDLYSALDRAVNVDLFQPFKLVEKQGKISAEYESIYMEAAGVDLDRVDLYIAETILQEFEVIPGGLDGQQGTEEHPHSYSLDPFTQGYINEAVDHEEDLETGAIEWEDLPIEMARKMMADAEAFQQQNAELLKQAYGAGLKPARAGQLFFQSRNRLRDVGFDAVDNNLGKIGQQLARAASRFGKFWISGKKVDTNLYRGPLHERVRVWEFDFRDAVQKLAKMRPSAGIPTDGEMHPTNALLRSPELDELKHRCAILQSRVNTNHATNAAMAAADPYPTRLGPSADRTDSEREHMDRHLDRWVSKERVMDNRANGIERELREIEDAAFAIGKKYGVNGIVVLALAVQDFNLGYNFKYN
jgi:hypothetical protein